MNYLKFAHINELSFKQGRRRRVFWPSPLNHPPRMDSFIIVTIISISLTRKSCDKSLHTSFCDSMYDPCREIPVLLLFWTDWLQVFYSEHVLWIKSHPAKRIPTMWFKDFLSHILMSTSNLFNIVEETDLISLNFFTICDVRTRTFNVFYWTFM